MAEHKTLDEKEFRRLVSSLGFEMTPKDHADYFALVREMEDEVLAVDDLPEYIDPVLVPSDAAPLSSRHYYVPEKKDNPFNAWSHRFELKDGKAVATGILAGRSVALKDTVSVAGIPLTLGTEPYRLSKDRPYPIPTVDAPVVTRILESGGVVAGTGTCEYYCMSGLSDTSASGPVDNPWLPGYSSGGSSSGCGVLTAIKLVRAWREKRGIPVGDLGDGVDLAIGGDQGGSIRLPAAYCGVYGLKPTHGLVPYTGIGALHPIADHAGPIAGSLSDTALLLSAIAGWDGLDPRASPTTPLRASVPAYHELLDKAIADKKARGEWSPTTAGRGLRVGLLKEAAELPGMDPQVLAVVRNTAKKFERLGATVVNVSVPLHEKGGAIWTACMRGSVADVFLNSKAPDLPNYTPTGVLPAALDQAWYEKVNMASPMVVTAVLGSAYLSDTDAARFPQRYRNKALMHAVQLRAAYDKVLAEQVDVLLLPVTPSVAPPHHTRRDFGVLDMYRFNLGVSSNTGPFNVSGHPALAMPGGWGTASGPSPGKLPIGIQIVGKHNDEVGVLLAGSILEVAGLGLDDESTG